MFRSPCYYSVWRLFQTLGLATFYNRFFTFSTGQLLFCTIISPVIFYILAYFILRIQKYRVLCFIIIVLIVSKGRTTTYQQNEDGHIKLPNKSTSQLQHKILLKHTNYYVLHS